MKQLTKDQAIQFFDTKSWEALSFEERAKFQISQERLCMPFGVFHEAVEKTINRPIFTHEFGLNYDGLRNELNGGNAPTLEEIVNLIPEDKRGLVIA